MSTLDSDALVRLFVEHHQERGNPNAEKLAVAFAFWLDVFDLGLRAGFNYTQPVLGIVEHLCAAHGLYLRRKSGRGRSGALKSKLWSAVGRVPLHRGVLPGGVLRDSDRWIMQVTLWKLATIAARVDEAGRSDFLGRMEAHTAPEARQALRRALPGEFFLRQTRAIGLPLTVRGAPTALFNEPVIRLLFASRPIRFEGVQHGGGFGELASFRVEQFERSFSDQYLHWGLGPENIIQPRYPRVAPTGRFVSAATILGTMQMNKIYSFLMGVPLECYEQMLYHREDLVNSFRPEIELGFAPHYKNAKAPVSFSSVMPLADTPLSERRQTLFILDWPGHTFFYEAIYQCLPIVLYYDRKWLDFFTPQYVALLERMHEVGLLFFWDEQAGLRKRVGQWIRGEEYGSGHFQLLRAALEGGRDRQALNEIAWTK